MALCSRLAVSIVFTWLVVSCIASTSWGDYELRRPNVIFVLTDDHGALDAGCYGSSDIRTPNIDAVAKRGVRFTNAYAHTVCCPARAMLLTGRHPQRGDIGSWAQGTTSPLPTGRNLLHSETTIAEAFRDAGYATALFGKWHIGAAETHGPTRQGFDEFFGIRGGFIDNYSHIYLHDPGRHDLYEATEEVFRDGEYFMDMVTDRSIEWIQKQGDRPFMLYYAMNLPHYPEQSTAEFDDQFESLAEPRRSYAKILATTDHYIGRLLSQLDQQDIRDDTILVIAGDNGYSAEDYQIDVDNHLSGKPKGTNYGANGGGGNSGRWRGSKGSFLEGGLRVPSVISYPNGFEGNRTSDVIVTLMDWFPTVADFANVDVSGIQLDGRSVADVCSSGALSDDHYDEMNWQWQKGWAARRGEWKLIVGGTLGLAGDGVNAMNNRMPKTFLGNLSDPQPERKNYAEDRPDLVRQLTQQHENWAVITQAKTSAKDEVAVLEQHPNRGDRSEGKQ